MESLNNVQNSVNDTPWSKADLIGGDLTHLKARKDLTDEFKRKMLYDNPVRFYRFNEGDIAAARKAKGKLNQLSPTYMSTKTRERTILPEFEAHEFFFN